MNFRNLQREWGYDGEGLAPFLDWAQPVARGWDYGGGQVSPGPHHVIRAQSCVILYTLLRG